MKEVQQAIVNHLKAVCDSGLIEHFGLLNDNQITQMLFIPGNHLCLTPFGFDIMQRHYCSCTITVPDGELDVPLHLTFLDDIARMPYFINANQLMLYDHLLAFRLRMVEGRISILRQIE